MIRVKPSSANRQPFAKWCVQHRIRTVSSTTFGVPDHLFPRIPEDLLDGALVDGQPYIAAEPGGAPTAAPAAAKTPARTQARRKASIPAQAPVPPVAPEGENRGENMPADIPVDTSSQVNASDEVENHEPDAGGDATTGFGVTAEGGRGGPSHPLAGGGASPEDVVLPPSTPDESAGDEPAEQVAAAFEAGEKGVTAPPEGDIGEKDIQPDVTPDESPQASASDASPDEPEHYCTPCGRRFASEHGLTTHNRMKHGDVS